MYFMLDVYLKNVSNKQCTILSMALGETKKVLDDLGLSMPEHLVVQCDNMATMLRNKIQAFFNFPRWQKIAKTFRSEGDSAAAKGPALHGVDPTFSQPR